MKTKIYLFFTFVVLTLTSCTVDVPDEMPEEPKSESPQFSFKVEGDGFSHTFTEDDFDNYQLNLKANVNYEFTFSGSDDQGLKSLIWTYPGGLENYDTYLILPEQLPEGWRETSRYVPPELIDGVRFEGNIENPMSNTELTGKFSSYSSYNDYYFDFRATDFRDPNGEENVTEATLNLNFVEEDQPTEIVPID